MRIGEYRTIKGEIHRCTAYYKKKEKLWAFLFLSLFLRIETAEEDNDVPVTKVLGIFFLVTRQYISTHILDHGGDH